MQGQNPAPFNFGSKLNFRVVKKRNEHSCGSQLNISGELELRGENDYTGGVK
jgi:hypothetical protein